MNDIITNGTEIKQRITSEMNNARQNIYLAMAWFTDRDIANTIISAKNRNILVEIVLSSNEQNETVKQMFRDANINVHAFETGDNRGMMHHKFCLIDSKITINGSYNYSLNASKNNVENIQVSDDTKTYQQFFTEFERLKYNIDNQIDVNIKNNSMETFQPINQKDSFSKTLSNLVYSSVEINAEEYKKKGYEQSKESNGNVDIFKTNIDEIHNEITRFATDESLGNKKNNLISNVNTAFENKKAEFDDEKQNELDSYKRENYLSKKQINDKTAEIRQEKSILEQGNLNTSERGLFQINKEMEKNKLEKRGLEQSFIVKKFWTAGTIFALIGLCIFVYYLSMFFASAMYKVFFESNIIRTSLEAGINPGLPQLVDANAIIKIFRQQGSLFGIMAALFFLIPILLSNLKLLGSEKKWVNNLCFWVGLLIFDVLVSTMVALNTDEIKCLLVGKESQLQIWQVVEKGEFWMIFVFGMLPLIITHYIIDYIVNAYKKSQRDIVDAEKNRKIQILDSEMIDLNAEKENISNKLKEKEDILKQNSAEIQRLERELSSQQTQIENKYIELLKPIKTIYDDYIAKITSGKIFTVEILVNVISAYKSGFIEYLPEFYASNEVTNRVNSIDKIIEVNHYLTVTNTY
ncbi:hypothetical protein FACS18945_2130 [Bacteroidia bacterium]|nr:hypothetical protein FACS18945_2130 [Bacteroidia bacterium]